MQLFKFVWPRNSDSSTQLVEKGKKTRTSRRKAQRNRANTKVPPRTRSPRLPHLPGANFRTNPNKDRENRPYLTILRFGGRAGREQQDDLAAGQPFLDDFVAFLAAGSPPVEPDGQTVLDDATENRRDRWKILTFVGSAPRLVPAPRITGRKGSICSRRRGLQSRSTFSALIVRAPRTLHASAFEPAAARFHATAPETRRW